MRLHFLVFPSSDTTHSGQRIGKVGPARRLHLVQDGACAPDAKFGEHRRGGIIGHARDLLRSRIGVHARIDLDDVVFRLLQEILAQLQPLFILGALRLQFRNALPEFCFGRLQFLLLPRDAGIQCRVGNVRAKFRDVGLRLIGWRRLTRSERQCRILFDNCGGRQGPVRLQMGGRGFGPGSRTGTRKWLGKFSQVKRLRRLPLGLRQGRGLPRQRDAPQKKHVSRQCREARHSPSREYPVRALHALSLRDADSNILLDDEIGLQRARRLDRLQDCDNSRWLQPDLVQATHEALQIRAAQDRRRSRPAH